MNTVCWWKDRVTVATIYTKKTYCAAYSYLLLGFEDNFYPRRSTIY